MTALPPTKGHLHLVQFASHLASTVEVIVCTQPDEPFATERINAIRKAVQPIDNVNVHHIHRTLEQNPNADGFWEMWRRILVGYNCGKGDYVVASEPYGKTVADLMGARFMPYDIDRGIEYTRGTDIRYDAWSNFSSILPEFQPTIQQRLTVFGAESTGKTTLTKRIAIETGSAWYPEWARPYLENVENVIDRRSMTEIWWGQRALQKSACYLPDQPWIIQDTDLFSTVGYWGFWEPETMPNAMVFDAKVMRSDLYLITKSNIPFEQDPLRYGGDAREASDQYWINLCKEHELNYHVLESDNRDERLSEALKVMHLHWAKSVQAKLEYQRQSNS